MTSDDLELNLPIVRSEPLPHRSLSMDEYEAFIAEDLEICFDKAAYLKEKARRTVNVGFSLVDNK